MSTPPKVGARVSIPPLKGDELRSSTVLPYLDAYHYGTDEMEQDYYTEHDLTGESAVEQFQLFILPTVDFEIIFLEL